MAKEYVNLRISKPLGDRIAAILTRLRSYSANSFSEEAIEAIVSMCEDPEHRNVPDLVRFYDVALESKIPLRTQDPSKISPQGSYTNTTYIKPTLRAAEEPKRKRSA